MNKYLRKAALGLALVMAVSLFAGCGQKQENQGVTTKAVVTEATTETNESISLPLVDKPTKISIFQLNHQSALVKSYSEILAFQELEKRTGITIEWIHPTDTSNAGTTALNLMVAANDLPDIIFHSFGSSLTKYLDDGVIIKLNDLIDKYAPDIKRRVLDVPEIKRQLQLDDGTIAMFPQVDFDLRRNAYRGFIIRKDWLDTLNMSVPTNIDELYEVLTAFKQKDPNGNGIEDEIPFCDEKGYGMRNFSGAWGLREGFQPHPKTDQIVYGPIEPGYKEFLATMAKWYKEGLIDKEYGATDRKVLDAKMLNNTLGMTWGTASGYLTTYLNMMKDKDPKFNLVALPYLKGEDGKSYTTWDQTNKHISGYGGAISSSCKDPVLVTKFVNYCYSPEGDELLNWGIEGVSYNVVNGKKKFTDAVMNDPDGLIPSQAIIKFVNNVNGWMRIYDMDAMDELASKNPPQANEAGRIWNDVDTSILMPILTPTADEAQKLANIMAEVTPYFDMMQDKFIMGIEPIEKFDEFVNTIKKMGIDEALRIQNAAYERYKARK